MGLLDAIVHMAKTAVGALLCVGKGSELIGAALQVFDGR